jgi:integral membrane protein (TIGR01906 family)
MAHAPAPVAFLLAVSVAVLIALLGPLLLFNPWYVAGGQARAGVPALLATSQQEVDDVTSQVLADIWLGGDFAVSLDGTTPLLTDAERSHMRDVSSFVRLLAVIALTAAVVLFGCLLALRHERRRIGSLLLTAASGVGLAAVLIGLLFAVAFEPTFLAFHEIFFSQGNFLFGPDSNLLRLFPEPFWIEASLVAGGVIVVTALAVAGIGWRLLSRSATPAA